MIIFFDQAQSKGTDIAVVGGKAANLIILTAAGFPVPSGFVVTSQAHEQFMDSADWLDAAAAKFIYDQPDRLREQCVEIRARLTGMPLPQSLESAIHDAVQKMDTGGQMAFAVRSSSTFEDLAQTAFAGQHDTYLNVHGFAQIIVHVRACFASLWEDRAVLYRYQHGFSQTQGRMAVIVQRQIECEVAGVAFSIDPVGGRMDRMVIDANYGLGESVVAGESEVDHFEVIQPSLEIAARSIGHKVFQTVCNADGIEKFPVPLEQVDRPCLSDEQITAIATLLNRVQVHYGWPQDIEWGITAVGIHLLQSRPVTTIQPDWTRDESAERFPNPMTPLSWDFISIAFGSSLRHSLSLMGLPPLKGDWFHIFDHHIYGDQNAVRLLAMFRPVEAKNAAELAAEIPALRRRFAWVIDLPVIWARDLDHYLIRLGRLEARPQPASLIEAWRFVTDVLEVAQDYFLPNIAISMTQSGLHRLLHSLIVMVTGPHKALAILDGLLAGCETKTAMVNREIHEMAVLASGIPQLRSELLTLGGQAFIKADRLQACPLFASRFQQFLTDHGHREVDMDYGILTWSGQPWVVLDSMKLLIEAPDIQDPADVQRCQRIRYVQTEQQFLAAVPRELDFFFRELIRLTRTYTMLDDLEHYQTTRINPLAHRAALNLGGFLRNLGVLDDPQDVFFLNKADLQCLIANPSEDAIERCRKATIASKSSFFRAKEHAPMWSLGQAAASPTTGNVLHGLPGSPGRASGPCFRIRGPEDFGRFPPKSVLVARTTNPAWTSLFYTAAAVITESGGPLSHGAVTAREMGLPAVMSVRGLMDLISDGQVVNVDGTNGTVELIAPD